MLRSGTKRGRRQTAILRLMTGSADLGLVGSLVGDRARATILTELLDGRALTAMELAARAGVTPATASVHLARLLDGGLLAVLPQGRHRYFRLRSREVARALETLAGLAPRPAARGHSGPGRPGELRFARTCYDHLAGWLGVAFENTLVDRKLLQPDGSAYRVTPKGSAWLVSFGVDAHAARQARRSFLRPCLDWSERRHHLAGALAQSLLDRLIDRGWLARQREERALDVLPAGRRGLRRELGIVVPDSDLTGRGIR